MIVLLVSAQFAANAAPAQQDEMTYETFYDALMSYGTWIDYPEYGYVWHPDVEDFRPYATNGYWEYTDEGWYWESGYDWGWAPFHYGDWFYDDAYGWLWEPGYEWSPAQVDWGMNGDYYAWAAKGPTDWEHHDHEWNMVDAKNFYDRDLFASLVTRDRMMTDAARIRPIYMGPDVKEVERHSGAKVRTKRLRDVDKKMMQEYRKDASMRRKVDDAMMQQSMETAMLADYMTDNVVYVYRPVLSRDVRDMPYRKVMPEDTRLVKKGDSWPSGNYDRYHRNIEKMPRHTGNFHDCDRMRGRRK